MRVVCSICAYLCLFVLICAYLCLFRPRNLCTRKWKLLFFFFICASWSVHIQDKNYLFVLICACLCLVIDNTSTEKFFIFICAYLWGFFVFFFCVFVRVKSFFWKNKKFKNGLITSIYNTTCDQIRRKLQIWSYLLKKSLIENFIFYAVCHLKNDRNAAKLCRGSFFIKLTKTCRNTRG